MMRLTPCGYVHISAFVKKFVVVTTIKVCLLQTKSCPISNHRSELLRNRLATNTVSMLMSGRVGIGIPRDRFCTIKEATMVSMISRVVLDVTVMFVVVMIMLSGMLSSSCIKASGLRSEPVRSIEWSSSIVLFVTPASLSGEHGGLETSSTCSTCTKGEWRMTGQGDVVESEVPNGCIYHAIG